MYTRVRILTEKEPYSRPQQQNFDIYSAEKKKAIRLMSILFIAAVLCWQVWIAWRGYHNALENGYLSLEIGAQQRSERMSSALRNISLIFNRMSERLTEGNQLRQSELDALREQLPEVLSLHVLNNQGTIILTTERTLIGRAVSDREYFRYHLNQAANDLSDHISRPIKTWDGKYYIMAVSRAVRDDEGKLRNVVVAAIDPRLYQDILAGTRSETAIEATLVNRFGDVIGAYPAANEKLIGQSLFGGIGFTAHLAANAPMTRHLNRTKLTGAYQAAVFQDIPNTGLVMITAERHDRIVSAWWRQYFAEIIAFAGVMAAAIILSRLAAQRQKKLASAYFFTRDIIESANTMIIGIDAAANVTLFNRLAEELTGYSRAEVFGRNIAAMLFAPEAGETLRQRFQLALDQGPEDQELEELVLDSEIRTKDGRTLVISWQYSFLPENLYNVKMISFGRDVSELRAKEEDLLRSRDKIESLYKWKTLLLNTAATAIVVVDRRGDCTFINPAALKMLGFLEQEVLGREIHRLWHHHHPDGTPYEQADCPIYQTAQDGLVRKLEDVYFRKNGEPFPVQATIAPMMENNQVTGVEVLFEDISQRKEIEAELLRFATTDTLTGLANRRHFLQTLDEEFARADRAHQTRTSLLMADIDHFKKVNDTYGHNCGDIVLQAFARLVRETIRKTDTAGRLGGEEFAIILPETGLENAAVLAERLRERVAEERINTSKGDVQITISIGLTEFSPADVNPDQVLSRCDEALYKAKNSGRNRVYVQ